MCRRWMPREEMKEEFETYADALSLVVTTLKATTRGLAGGQEGCGGCDVDIWGLGLLFLTQMRESTSI